MRAVFLWLAVLSLGGHRGWAQASAPPLLQNGSFENIQGVRLDAAGLYNGWQIVGEPRVPVAWALNSHYTGRLEIRSDGAYEGQIYVRLRGGERSGHIYQMLEGVEAGRWHRISLWARGEGGGVSAYHYFKSGPMGGAQIGNIPASSEWRQFVGYWQAPAENFDRAAIAISVGKEQTLDVDKVQMEPLAPLALPTSQKEAVFENSLMRLAISPAGLLADFTCKPLQQSYLGEPVPVPILGLVRAGRNVPLVNVTGEKDILTFHFVEPEVRVKLRIVSRPRHFLLEIVEAQPEDIEEIIVQFPIKRLARLGPAFGAVYDDIFGACLFCASLNSYNRFAAGAQSVTIGGGCKRKHGLVGAKFVLIGAPAKEFKAAVIEAEKANGLPCPFVKGQWMRDSESVRKSYLFATGSNELQIDTLIEYAKTAGFGTIIFLKDDWLANHGHFDINLKNFPEGIKSLRRAVQKIHQAGLEAGVHVFGPSISPHDPYVTPQPDPRLYGVACPPVASNLDDKATTIVVSGQPPLPPKTRRTQATPGYYIQIGEEIIRYSDIRPVESQPGLYQFVGCQRGALGTKASAHPAGTPVKGLITLWGYFLVDPDSTLAEELTSNFARVFNAAGFDFVYFDASDGLLNDYLEPWYYLNKLHMGFWHKIGRPVLYQTSNGTGTNLCWHIVPRSASADGHGDIKGYLDERWPGILGMANNWTKADIGWYYWFRDVRPDQIEYVCARALGIEGSISIETSVEATERLVQSRQMYEMVGRWERARKANVFSPAVKAKLLEPGKDFKVFQDARGVWRLYRVAYEEPRIVNVLDGVDNVFTIQHTGVQPCVLGFELVRPRELYPLSDYESAQAKVVETFDDMQPWRASETNRYEPFVIGEKKIVTETGIYREGTEFSVSLTKEAKVGASAFLIKATNHSDEYGWTGIGRRFMPALDLRGYKGVGLWIKGDGKGETIRVQFRDAAGRNLDFLPVINYSGWRLHFFPLPPNNFDWQHTEYLLLYFNGIPPKQSVEVIVDEVKFLAEMREPLETGQPVLIINGRALTLPSLRAGTALCYEGVGSVKLWPGGFKPAQPVPLPTNALRLQPGTNRITLQWREPSRFPGNVHVLLYRVWEMEKD